MSEVDRSLVNAEGVVVSDQFTVYDGRIYPVVSPSLTHVHLKMDEATAERHFSGVQTRPSPGGFVAVRVPKTALDRYFKRSITAWWRRSLRVHVEALVEDRARIYVSAPAQLGLELGLVGDQYMGWWGECPVSELSGLEQEIRELRMS